MLPKVNAFAQPIVHVLTFLPISNRCFAKQDGTGEILSTTVIADDDAGKLFYNVSLEELCLSLTTRATGKIVIDYQISTIIVR